MLRDLLRYRANAVYVGGVVLAIFLVFLGVAFAINRTFTLTFWDKGYELKADFVDADGIANASDVRISGVYVGQVTDIRSVSGGLAEITFRVDKEHAPLHEGTKANLRLQTLLGQKFIELVPGPGNGKELSSDTVIQSNATASPVDFDQLLSSFNKPTRNQLSGLIQEGGNATQGRGEDINALLGDLHSLSVNSQPDLETFADRSQNVDSILRNLNDVGGNLADNRTHLANTFTNLDSVLATLAQNDSGLRTFIEQGNIGAGHGVAQLQGEHQNIQSIISQLRPALDKLNPELADVTRLDQQFNAFINLSQPFVSDIFSAVSGYNYNPANTNCGPPGCGGFYLRQPTILANNGCVSPACTPENGSAAAAASANGTSSASAPASLNLAGLTGSTSNPLSNLVGSSKSQSSSSSPPPSNGAINSLLNYLLGH
jgi:phospholipid/cholesterol/gamma-HCH transport system substrate-binding protein